MPYPDDNSAKPSDSPGEDPGPTEAGGEEVRPTPIPEGELMETPETELVMKPRSPGASTQAVDPDFTQKDLEEAAEVVKSDPRHVTFDEVKQEAMDGSPAVIETPFIRIQFQCGVVPEVEKNGCTIREVIQLLIKRLLGFQAGEFKCQENADALYHLSTALRCLNRREEDRKDRGVEGKHKS